MILPSRLRRVRQKGVGFLGPDGEPWTGAKPVCVDRSTKWGNPFVVGTDRVRDREHATRMFAAVLCGNLPLDVGPDHATLKAAYERMHADLHELMGHPLACWCPHPEPGRPDHCHAAVLIAHAARLANTENELA